MQYTMMLMLYKIFDYGLKFKKKSKGLNPNKNIIGHFGWKSKFVIFNID